MRRSDNVSCSAAGSIGASAPRLAWCLAALLCVAVGGCTLTIDGEPVVEVSDFLALSQEKPEPDANEISPTSDELTRKYRQYKMTDAEKAAWSDPNFKRRFVESYIAETEVEPPLREMERQRVAEILPLMEDGELDQAEKLLQRYRGEASSAVFDYLLGNLYFQREQIDQAVAAYKEATKKYRKFRRAHRNLGLIYVRIGEHDKAVAALTRVIELGGGDAVMYGLLGFSYSMTEKPISAESAYRMAILMDPETVDWKRGLASSFFRQKRFAEAVAICDRIIQDDLGNAEIWMLQANAYIGMGKPLQAAENYEFVDRLGKSNIASLSMLGDIYINEKLYEMAASSYVRAMERTPSADTKDPNAQAKVAGMLERNTDRIIRAAKVMAARGALDATETLLQTLREQRREYLEKGDRKDLLKLEARIAVARGADEKQVKILEEIVRLDPMDGEALMLLGRHYANAPGDKRDIEKAIFYYELAEKNEKFEADAKVQHAQLLVREEEYDKAIPLLKSAQSIQYRDNVQKYLEQVQRIAKQR
ncbi:MAG: tetratricopeptide repeat protein [Phycisphaerae bacterium]